MIGDLAGLQEVTDDKRRTGIKLHVFLQLTIKDCGSFSLLLQDLDLIYQPKYAKPVAGEPSCQHHSSATKSSFIALKRLIVLHGLDSLMHPKKPLSALIANANALPTQAVNCMLQLIFHTSDGNISEACGFLGKSTGTSLSLEDVDLFSFVFDLLHLSLECYCRHEMCQLCTLDAMNQRKLQ